MFQNYWIMYVESAIFIFSQFLEGTSRGESKQSPHRQQQIPLKYYVDMYQIYSFHCKLLTV